MNILDRFNKKLGKTSSCWNWIAGKSKGRTNYYGTFYLRGKYEKAHRASFKIFKGEIPEGMTVDHICGNTLCVNPDHLRCITMEENATWNTRTGEFGRRKTCSRGHSYTEQNTFFRKMKNGKIHRQCNDCRRFLYLQKKLKQLATYP